MKKKTRKISAFLASLLLAAVWCAVPVSMTASAEGPAPSGYDETTATQQKASSTDRTVVKILNLTAGDTVTLYKIGQAEYNAANDSFVKFTYVTWDDDNNNETPNIPYTFSNAAEPAMQEITIAANLLQSGEITPFATYTQSNQPKNASGVAYTDNYTVNSSTFEANVEAGIYIAVVTPGAENDKVYNPVLLTASYAYKDAQTGDVIDFIGGGVDIAKNYDYVLDGGTAVAKSSSPTIVKTVTDGAGDEKRDGTNIMTGSVGTVLTYTIKPDLPGYPLDAVNKTFFVADSMGDGLTFLYDSIKIEWDTYKVNGSTDTRLTADTAGYFSYPNPDYDDTKDTSDENPETITIARAKKVDNGFNLVFFYDTLKYKAPVVTYNAVIDEDAVIGSNGNINTADLYYANNPTRGQTHSTHDTTPTTGTATGINKVSTTETVYTYELKFVKRDSTDANKKLAGAVFGVYSDADCTKLVTVLETNEDGIGSTTQLGAGQYWLKEISAPVGYSLSETITPVTVTWKTATTKTTNAVTNIEYTDKENEKLAGTSAVGFLHTVTTGTAPDLTTTVTFYEELPAGKTVGQDGWSVAYVKSAETTNNNEEFTTEQGEGAGVYTVGEITNTKLTKMPSTGGAGTYVLTIVGVAVFGTAAAIILKDNGKKKED
ncbi:MAG: LPXTG cell wall anchor domain-containing protein [Oscillospiraceae bacterium]|nr:LPXTG cell wall anchor domain-containing protein [Oscillospiraceae bacterium]